MKKDIQNYIRTCHECQLKKLRRIKTKQSMVHQQLTDIPQMGFDNISMDVLGPLRKTAKQHEYILTIQDLLTKYSLAILLKTITSIDIADAFICRFGSPRAIVTDQGSNFISSLMKMIAKLFMIQ